MNISSSLVVKHYSLKDLVEKKDIQIAMNVVFEELDKGHITRIVNAFLDNTMILNNGWVYLKLKGLSSILRTGVSGIERTMVYNGIPKIMGPSEIIEINGEEYVSQHDFIKMLSFRLCNASMKRTELYLKVTYEIYLEIIRNDTVRDLNLLFNQKIEEKRSELKQLRIKEYNIVCCEFTGVLINDFADYQFAHLDAVAFNRSRALDINNGVIIHKDIHSEMTDLGLNRAEDIYLYCKNNNYSVEWAANAG